MPPRRASPIRRSLLALVLTLSALTGLLIWLAGSDSALQWGLRELTTRSGGQLAVRDARGSLLGALHIGSLNWTTEQRRIELTGIDLDWSPSRLLLRQLRINALHGETLRIVTLGPEPDPGSLALPNELRLPLGVQVPDLTLAQLIMESGEDRLELGAIKLAVEQRSGRIELTVHSLASPWGTLRGKASVADQSPFDLTANVDVARADTATDGLPAYTMQATVNGTASRLALDATARTLGGTAHLTAQIAPLDPRPLISGRLTASGVDPSRFGPGLPSANVGGEIAVERGVAQSNGTTTEASPSLTGRFVVSNAAPGRWDAGRLPLRELSGELSGVLSPASGLPEVLALNALKMDLGDAGHFTGSGRVAHRQFQLDLRTSGIDPQELHSKMRPFKLAGELHLTADANAQELVSDLRDTQTKSVSLHLAARHRNHRLELHELGIVAGQGRLAAQGWVDLDDTLPFELSGNLTGFNPADFGDFPLARLNATFASNGYLASPQATLRFTIADSRLQGHPLTGKGSLTASDTRLSNVDIALQLATNRFTATGAFGADQDRLDVQAEARNLGAINAQLGGQVQLSGTLEGGLTAPAGTLRGTAKGLTWGKDYRVASLVVDARLDKGIAGNIALQTSLHGLVAGQQRIDEARLEAHGTRAKHTLELQAKGGGVDLESRLRGGWDTTRGWTGELVDLVSRGRHAFTLQAPVTISAAARRLTLGRTHIVLSGADRGAQLTVADFTYDAGRLATSGTFNAFPLAGLGPFGANRAEPEGDPRAALGTDLKLGGRWRLTLAERVEGSLSIWRESGDITYAQEEKIALGLSRLSLDAAVADNRLQLQAAAEGAQLGRLKATAQTQLTQTDGRWGVARGTPLAASADLAISSLAWLQPLAGNAVVFNGAVNAQLSVGGTLDRPTVDGTLAGDKIDISLPEQGIALKKGRLRATLADQTLRLDELILHGGDGTVSATGKAALEGGSPKLNLALKADRLEALARPDRHLVVSGGGELSIGDGTMAVKAKLKADRGLIEMPRAETPTLGDDVIVLGQADAAPRPASPYKQALDLEVDLGERFFIKGKGLDAQLGGALTLKSSNGALPTSRGTIRVIKGAYAAYGQRLDIEHGFLNFQGPLDNPGLNIVALRKHLAVEAGVSVTGTAQAPRVRLVSTPTVPDGEKLSWLVLGHGPEGSSAQEFSVLQTAAGALLDAGESITLQQRIAQAAGLDEVGLKGAGGLEGTVLELGKRLSSRAYLSYEQGLAGTSSLVKINYTLTKRLSVRVQTGLSSALDLLYTFSFD